MVPRLLNLALIFAVLAVSPAFAVTCADIDYPPDVKISVVIEDGDDDPRKISVRVPAVVFGKSLTWIYLWVSADNQTGNIYLQVPIQFEVEGSEALAEFFAQQDWNAAEITAHYGDKICDPSLQKVLWDPK